VSETTQETEEITRSAWHDALELITKEHEGDEVTIELVRNDLGDQREAVALPLNYLEYDRKDDVVVVGVGGHSTRFPVVLRHMIRHPQSISVTPPAPAIQRALCVTDAEGTETLVILRKRPELPA
jgi:hypothetical protein